MDLLPSLWNEVCLVSRPLRLKSQHKSRSQLFQGSPKPPSKTPPKAPLLFASLPKPPQSPPQTPSKPPPKALQTPKAPQSAKTRHRQKARNRNQTWARKLGFCSVFPSSDSQFRFRGRKRTGKTPRKTPKPWKSATTNPPFGSTPSEAPAPPRRRRCSRSRASLWSQLWLWLWLWQGFRVGLRQGFGFSGGA